MILMFDNVQKIFKSILFDHRRHKQKIPKLEYSLYPSFPQMMYRFSPNRSDLFGKGADLAENMQALEEFLPPLQANLKQVHDFYTLHNLHCLKKV